ncbi:helix-turn-helix transcriptional regulator [Geomonas subterranea]|uniref:helix-turn-helix transcriptional regulator n=1 Tax=Geomonas subterranea TaxID=2847989 RepID=UPI001EEF7E1D|nr:helix-turn-helix transcriptional regulator [Geomonas subterranea]
MTAEGLSRVAHFSKFHFHRQFTLYTGMGVFAFIRQMRLKHASYRLCYRREERIIDIALDAGFESPEAFSRVFKQMFGQSSSQFRKSPEWHPWKECSRPPPTLKKRRHGRAAAAKASKAPAGICTSRLGAFVVYLLEVIVYTLSAGREGTCTFRRIQAIPVRDESKSMGPRSGLRFCSRRDAE